MRSSIVLSGVLISRAVPRDAGGGQTEDTRTRVHLVHSGWRSDRDREAARQWQERAWAGAFRQLEQVVTRE